MAVGSCFGAEPTLPPALRGVGFDQRVNEQVPLDLAFRDEAGRDVRLGDYFHGKPVILVLAWYRCPMLCTEVLNGLTRAMLDMSLSAGKDFQVVTVSFDPREGPELAAAKKKTYLERYGRPGGRGGLALPYRARKTPSNGSPTPSASATPTTTTTTSSRTPAASWC